MKGDLEKWLATNNPQKPEEVQFLGTKPKLMSKAAAAAKRAAKKPNAKAKTTAASAKTTAPSRKTKISFADEQKEKTLQHKLVISWSILVKYKENSTTKEILETALGKILHYFRETAAEGKSDAAILPRPSAPKKAKPILSAEYFPEHIVTWKENYAEIDPKVYNNIYKGKSKKIQG